MSTWTIENESVNQFDVHFKQESATGTYMGGSEFYTGLKKGERVKILRDTYTHSDGKTSVYYSCALIDGGCWLSLYEDASSIVID
jgi:hypothetical protein